jgi:hypothetical protein
MKLVGTCSFEPASEETISGTTELDMVTDSLRRTFLYFHVTGVLNPNNQYNID